MKILHVTMLIGALTLIGCARESPKGGPGAAKTGTTGASKDTKTTTTTATTDDDNRDTTKTKTTTTTTKNDTRTDRDNTFSVRVPSVATNITQGKREEVTISINRDGDFDQPVNLKFQAPQGIKIVPAEASIKTGETKTNVFVEAAEDAPVGRHSITVTGSPQTGAATSVKMDVDIKKKG
jgi:hypothetical protein